MSYTVLARRYRSQSFDDVVGQQPVARTLKNAIGFGRVAHAYLFCGTRGVGKTSMARLFARALNAPDTIADAPKPDDQFPELEVQQRMADAIMRGEDLNVIEIDGASNRGVDDARDLISKAGLSPTANARYKVYIIDEVHMLTREAFNALLKTMEEPPSHVKFILCTTEPHKLPPTILSRCQRFDFRNIPARKIADHLRSVLAKEQIDATDEVVFQLAVLGNGSMRDALSLLDRMIATGDNPLTVTTVEQTLGLPAAELVSEVIRAIADGDPKATLEAVAGLLNRGIAQEQVVEVLTGRLRQLMLIAACGPDSDLVELSDEARAAAAGEADRFDVPALVHMIALCENLSRHMHAAADPRALLDATAVRLALSEKMADVTAILAGGAPSLPKKKVAADADRPDGRRSGVPVPAGAEGLSEPAGVDGSPEGPVRRAAAAPSGQVPGTPAEVWTALCERVGRVPSMAFVDHLCLASLTEGTAVVEALPGQREIARFAGMEQRRKRLADELMAILGRRVEVVVREPGAAGADDGADHEPPAARGGAMSAGDRRAAMALPLVRDAIEVFPDAMPIAFRESGDED